MKDVINNMIIYEKDGLKVEAEKVNSSLQLTWTLKKVKVRQQLFIEHRFLSKSELCSSIHNKLFSFFCQNFLNNFSNKTDDSFTSFSFLRKNKKFIDKEDMYNYVYINSICDDIIKSFIDFEFI